MVSISLQERKSNGSLMFWFVKDVNDKTHWTQPNKIYCSVLVITCIQLYQDVAYYYKEGN